MATFHILNFGCRATQADAAAIERQLQERGLTHAPQAEAAGVVVVNTCTVTSDADAVARQAIRRIHRENPAAHIVVTGCYAQRAPEELAQIAGVAHVIGNSHQTQISALVGAGLAPPNLVPLQALAEPMLPTPVGQTFLFTLRPRVEGPLHDSADSLGGHTRPILKIQDGCNNRCAFCVIPFVRGRSRSLPPAQVMGEVRRLAEAGYKEVVLSGINLGSYGRDLAPRVEFADLVRRVLDETLLSRLRISSIEPMDVTADLVNLFASSDRIARHFHVPLQSGSDRILAAMHRWYRAAHYARHIGLIRERLPEAAIGADVIAGFPGETDDDHRATLRLIEELPFTYLHVFAFSKRPGTEAARLLDAEVASEVPPQIIKQRSKELRKLAAAKNAAFRGAQLGRTLRVLTLHRQGRNTSTLKPFNASTLVPWTEALSDNYLKVRLPGSWPANTFLDVRITASAESHLLAELT